MVDKQIYNYFIIKQMRRTLETFPKKLSDLDLLGQCKMQINENLDFPEYKDPFYIKRKAQTYELAQRHKMGQLIEQLQYTPDEHELWRRMLHKFEHYHSQVMCRQYLQSMKALRQQLDFHQKVPSINNLSSFLTKKTGFQIKPVPGIISQRDFLNCLALKVFCSGSLLRHPLSEENAPEPDVVHEFVGHVPMFANHKIAAISHKLGLLSLEADEQELIMLGGLYVNTMEFGVCSEKGKERAFGAGIASCMAELKKLGSGRASFQPFKIKDCFGKLQFEDYQPSFFRVINSIDEIFGFIDEMEKRMNKPNRWAYNQLLQQIQPLTY